MLKIKPQQIAFDIDGVVADTMSSFIKVARDEFGINNIKREQITSYWLEECLPIDEDTIKAIIQRILEDPFGTHLRPLPGATETLTQLAQSGPVTFITARPIREPIVDWLRHQLSGVPEDSLRVVATGQHDIKVEILMEMNIPYFVEDHLETCQAICSKGLKAIVFDHPWNQGLTPFYRVHNWKELRSLLDLS